MKQIIDTAFSSPSAFMGCSIVFFVCFFTLLFFLFRVLFLFLSFCNIITRTVNVWIRGWPPKHCDSAGNVVHKIVIEEQKQDE